MAAALRICVPGDIVIVAEGTYHESVCVPAYVKMVTRGKVVATR